MQAEPCEVCGTLVLWSAPWPLYAAGWWEVASPAHAEWCSAEDHSLCVRGTTHTPARCDYARAGGKLPDGPLG